MVVCNFQVFERCYSRTCPQIERYWLDAQPGERGRLTRDLLSLDVEWWHEMMCIVRHAIVMVCNQVSEHLWLYSGPGEECIDYTCAEDHVIIYETEAVVGETDILTALVYDLDATDTHD